jgi:hypothetical protein
MGLTSILPLLLRLLVNDWYYVEFTAWAHPYTSSTTPSTSSRLVLRRVYYISIVLILLVLLHLLIHDWYYVEFTARDSLPYCQYYSVYWFMTSTTWSLLHGLRSHASRNDQLTSYRLVLYVTEGASIP